MSHQEKAYELAKAVNTSMGVKHSAWTLRYENAVCKISAVFAHIITKQKNNIRVVTSKRNLDDFNHNLKEFLGLVITMDETQIHHNTPESREGFGWLVISAIRCT